MRRDIAISLAPILTGLGLAWVVRWLEKRA
jgi:hypothetical protein